MPEFEFLTFSKHPKFALQDETSRRAIRATATRATRSLESRHVAVSHELRSKATRQASQKGGTNRFRIKSQDPFIVKQSSAARSELSLPLTKHVSFWYSIVTPLGGEAWKLLQYYRFLFRSKSWAINAKPDWFTFVIQSQAATHATLSFVSLNRDLEEGSEVSTWTLHHRVKAMQLIRQGIESSFPHPSDGLMGAVALAAITAGLEGDSLTSITHAKALERLVELRGGPDEIRQNEALKRLLVWADLCRSSTVSEATRSSTLLKDTQEPSQSHVYFEPFSRSQSFHETAYLNLIQSLNRLPKYHPTEATPSREKQTVNRLIHRIDQQISDFRYHHCVSCDELPGLLAKALYSAAHLYVSLVLRQMPRRTNIIIKRSWNVRINLNLLYKSIINEQLPHFPFNPVVLWAMTVRYCSLLPQQRTTEEIFQFQHLINICGVTTFESLVELLEQVTWIADFCEKDLRQVCVDATSTGSHVFS